MFLMGREHESPAQIGGRYRQHPLEVKMNISRGRGGRSVVIMEALREGKTPQQIQRELGFSTHMMSAARMVLQGWDVDLPYQTRTREENRLLAERLRKSRDNREIKRLLRQVDLVFLKQDRKRERPLLLSVFRVARGAGFHFRAAGNMEFFVNSLKSPGMPVGKIVEEVKRGSGKRNVRHFFIAAQHRGWAKRVFLTDPSLQKFLENPVRQICGPEARVPTTTRLIEKDRFGSPSHLLAQFGIPIGTNRRLLPRLFDETCPVPVFTWGGKRFYPTGQEARLREFVAKRLEKMGMAEASQ